MSFPRPAIEGPPSEPVPRLLVELPSRSRAFFGNLAALTSPWRPALELQSGPGEFWPDVFVKRRLPWGGWLQSAVYHALAGALLIAISHLIGLPPRVITAAKFDHSQVVYYSAEEYLPPLDTRQKATAQPRKADPELAPQSIISLPPQADNRLQTIVTPPKVQLRREVALPNVVAWADEKKPRLAIPDAPLTPAAEISRVGPKLDDPVVAPAPDATRLSQQRKAPKLQNTVLAPPPQLQVANANSSFLGLEPALIAPPPSVESTSPRRLGEINIGASPVIAPAPQLPVAEQRSLPGGTRGPGVIAAQVVPPPPSVPSSGSSGASFGSRGRMIALSLHPAVGAPPDPPAGNRRGTFAATPEGHIGASGTPAVAAGSGNGISSSGKGNALDNGGSSTRSGKSEVPPGLYVGKAERSSAVAGTGATPAASVNPNLIADARPPRVSSTTVRPADSAAKLSEPERAIFSGRKYYSLTLNMPNLNSAGGSWVVHFAEAKPEPAVPDGTTPAVDISQPKATRTVDPAYPLQLMRENVAGTVILYAVIHANGTVGDVKVLRGVEDRLDRFASDAVAQWKFEPATKNGVPVDVEATFQIPFRPSRVGTGF
jgi:TonB family protein